MRKVAQQLVSVGYQPTSQPSPTTTHQEFAPVRASNRKVFEPKSLETILDGLIEPLVKPAQGSQDRRHTLWWSLPCPVLWHKRRGLRHDRP
jgi:hypothetical protein